MKENDRDRQDSQRWQAVSTNDTAADGLFLYGVRTTGVYCRPSCRSRTPRRENVRYFEDAASAQAAGAPTGTVTALRATSVAVTFEEMPEEQQQSPNQNAREKRRQTEQVNFDFT